MPTRRASFAKPLLDSLIPYDLDKILKLFGCFKEIAIWAICPFEWTMTIIVWLRTQNNKFENVTETSYERYCLITISKHSTVLLQQTERTIESITKTQKNYWIPWERGLRAVFCYVFVASYLYCSCALHVSVWSMRVVRLPGHCFLRVERHTFETLILNILLTLWKNIARVQNCPDITILRRSSISSTYSGQSVRPWYFRISILSASLREALT